MNIPLLDLKREYKFLKKDIDKELRDCFKSQQWILGPKVAQFEERVAKYLEVKHAIGVASGTDALILSLRALAIKLKGKEYFDKKDEIITTPFTFVATAEAITRSGAIPVFVDIDSNTFNIDPYSIEKAITKNTIGILPVHLYGLSCDMNKISGIAKKHRLFVVEDVAQAFGGRYKNKKLGTIGDLGAFSFFPSKNLGSYGDAGLITTSNSKLADLVKALRDHGQSSPYNASYVGYNSRLDSIQAAILLAKLKHIDKFNKLRINIAEEYNSAFKKIKDIEYCTSTNLNHVYNLYMIRVNSKREALYKYLISKGICVRIYYPVLLSQMKAFKNSKVKTNLKNAKEATLKSLALPIYPFLKNSEIKYITSTLRKFYQ